jgi:plastocyanin
MVNGKPVYIVAGIVAILGMIAFSSSGHFSTFAQESDVKVDIVPGASTKSGPSAYSMDPIKVKVGGQVTWTNKDSVQHTVTSGGPGSPDSGKEFDSGLTKLINSNATFEHTFTKAGTFPYYCQLHPAMTGIVIVS